MLGFVTLQAIPTEDSAVTCGIFLYETAWSTLVFADAAERLFYHVFDTLKKDRIYARAAATNHRALRAMGRLGFRYVADVEFKGHVRKQYCLERNAVSPTIAAIRRKRVRAGTLF